MRASSSFMPIPFFAEAQKIGFPVVVKPYNGNHGRGVSLDLGDGARVRAAFRQAREVSRAASAGFASIALHA